MNLEVKATPLGTWRRVQYSHRKTIRDRPVPLRLVGSSTPPVTDAVCVSQCLDAWTNSRVLIWTNEPRIEPLLVDWVRRQGGEVIESITVGDVMAEHDVEARSARDERHSYPLYNLYSGYERRPSACDDALRSDRYNPQHQRIR